MMKQWSLRAGNQFQSRYRPPRAKPTADTHPSRPSRPPRAPTMLFTIIKTFASPTQPRLTISKIARCVAKYDQTESHTHRLPRPVHSCATAPQPPAVSFQPSPPLPSPSPLPLRRNQNQQSAQQQHLQPQHSKRPTACHRPVTYRIAPLPCSHDVGRHRVKTGSRTREPLSPRPSMYNPRPVSSTLSSIIATPAFVAAPLPQTPRMPNRARMHALARSPAFVPPPVRQASSAPLHPISITYSACWTASRLAMIFFRIFVFLYSFFLSPHLYLATGMVVCAPRPHYK